MRHHDYFTLVIVPHNSGRVRRIRIHIRAIRVTAIVLLLFLASLFVFGKQYTAMLRNMAELAQLRTINAQQRTQINLLRKESANLQAQVAQLALLDQQVRALLKKAGMPVHNDEATIASGTEPTAEGTGGTASDNTATQGALSGQGGGTATPPELSNASSSLMEPLAVAYQTGATFAALSMQIPLRYQSLSAVKDQLAEYVAYLASKPSIWPVYGPVTSGFGWRRSPFGGRSKEFHDGYDIAVPYGTPVRVTGDGVVIFAGWKDAYGRTVIIDHGFGFQTLYAHNSRIVVREGQKVSRGQVIAYAGDSGRSTGPHVHYGVMLDGAVVDPADYLPGAH